MLARLHDHQNWRYFRWPNRKTKSWYKSKPTWKLKHANSILESFEYFCKISSKSIFVILSYTVLKLVHFLRHSVYKTCRWTKSRTSVTYVRPLVEYCSPVWSPSTIGQIKRVESVQKVFTKKLPGMRYLSYVERLSVLNLWIPRSKERKDWLSHLL